MDFAGLRCCAYDCLSMIPALAPFQSRSFRFQWPADLCTAWALEMETLVLGWYVLVETESVLLLTLFGSLQFVGTLISPMLGVLGIASGFVMSLPRCVRPTPCSPESFSGLPQRGF